MSTPTNKHLSISLITGLFLIVLAAAMEILRIPSPSPTMDAAMNLKFYEAILPDSVIEVLLIAFPLVAIAGTVGFVQCQSWGRSTLAVTMLLALILNTMNGLAVMRAEAASILALGCLLFAGPLILSFFPPCSDYFESKATKE